jgi:hypothetical protein
MYGMMNLPQEDNLWGSCAHEGFGGLREIRVRRRPYYLRDGFWEEELDLDMRSLEVTVRCLGWKTKSRDRNTLWFGDCQSEELDSKVWWEKFRWM